MNTKKGFTMIEVTLVLAIAGLLFAATLAVLPGLWASERDAGRRENVMKFITNLKSYQTNNSRGALPVCESGKSCTVTGKPTGNVSSTTWAGFYKEFFDDSFLDPNGTEYNLSVMECSNGGLGNECDNLDLSKIPSLEEVDYNLYVVTGATCDGDKAVGSANPRKVAVVYKLERAGQYCFNS